MDLYIIKRCSPLNKTSVHVGEEQSERITEYVSLNICGLSVSTLASLSSHGTEVDHAVR